MSTAEDLARALLKILDGGPMYKSERHIIDAAKVACAQVLLSEMREQDQRREAQQRQYAGDWDRPPEPDEYANAFRYGNQAARDRRKWQEEAARQYQSASQAEANRRAEQTVRDFYARQESAFDWAAAFRKAQQRAAEQQRQTPPAPTVRHMPRQRRSWREVLGFSPHVTVDRKVIDIAYRSRAGAAHPDKGGTHEQMVELNNAREEALRACPT